MSTKSTAISCLRYRNAPAAIDWLVRALGFEKRLVVPNDDGTIAHAQLTLNGGMIMLGSINDTPFSKHMKQPDEIGGAETQSSYLVIEDTDGAYQQAKAAGAKILMDIKDQDYGVRGFTCADPEGHIWSIGSYDPWS
jgi:uncharacterized glyoxalase superfamily protein PhnB